ncbi:hypothetical protein [Mycolicibacterium palauense]|uniref:hypothetical protein n=1 Tax=Mycolicibacterium palauense TaxID=2034511 RepID=UPI001145A08D|nr:hypothetical protein [Mycolicibacterium palauense]
MTDLWRRIPRTLLIRLAYLVVGLKFGSLWLVQGEGSPWIHALRLVVLMAVVMTVAEVVRRWAARRGRRVNHHALGRFLLAKLGVVALAVAAGLLLQDWLANANVWVGLGLAVVVAVAGPLIHPWLVRAADESEDDPVDIQVDTQADTQVDTPAAAALAVA